MSKQRTVDEQSDLADESFMSADDLRSYMKKVQIARASDSVSGMSQADKARDELVKELKQPIDLTPIRTQEIISSLLVKLRAAAQDGKTEALVMRFPNALCADKGRALNNSEPDWPTTLTGRPRQAYELWRDHLRDAGYRLSAAVIDWPSGMPGDIGFFLEWGEAKKK